MCSPDKSIAVTIYFVIGLMKKREEEGEEEGEKVFMLSLATVATLLVKQLYP